MNIFSLIVGYNIALIKFLYDSNKKIVTTHRTIRLKGLPAGFDGMRITHISDYHNAYFGKRAKHLLKKVRRTNPEVIFFTGDVIDRRTPNLPRAKRFIDDLSKIAPVYYVTGNHEIHYDGFKDLYNHIAKSSWQNISMNKRTLSRNGDTINLVGMNDLWFYGDEESLEIYDAFEHSLQKKMEQVDGFTILLSHRPELLKMYSQYGVDLVFSGHAHGGQFRLPIVKGLYAPHQGVLPKYTEGVYQMKDTKLHVSRGLGNSRFPFRLFNRPEIIQITLKSEKA